MHGHGLIFSYWLSRFMEKVLQIYEIMSAFLCNLFLFCQWKGIFSFNLQSKLSYSKEIISLEQKQRSYILYPCDHAKVQNWINCKQHPGSSRLLSVRGLVRCQPSAKVLTRPGVTSATWCQDGDNIFWAEISVTPTSWEQSLSAALKTSWEQSLRAITQDDSRGRILLWRSVWSLPESSGCQRE